MQDNGTNNPQKHTLNKVFILLLSIAIILGLSYFFYFIYQQAEAAEPNEYVVKEQKNGTTSITCTTGEPGGTYTFYQLPLTDTAGGFAYAIQMPDKKLVMIDSGYTHDGDYIKNFILKHGGKVDSWFITHPHFDHVGGLVYNMTQKNQNKIKVDNIYYSPFTSEYFENKEEGKNLEQLNNAVMLKEFEALREILPNTNFIPVERGDTIQIKDIIINCISSFNKTVWDVNTNSLVLSIDIKGVDIMVTGDITDYSVAKISEYLGEDNELADVDFIQIPHHGYFPGISNDIIYRMATPKFAFLDCSTNEYDTNAINILTHEAMVEALDIKIIKRFKGPNTIKIK